MSTTADLFALTGLRADGRRCGELRRLACKIAVMNRCAHCKASWRLSSHLSLPPLVSLQGGRRGRVGLL